LVVFFVIGEASFAFGAPHLFEILEPTPNPLGEYLGAFLAAVVEPALVYSYAVRTEGFTIIIKV
jgi:hypothetical protein